MSLVSRPAPAPSPAAIGPAAKVSTAPTAVVTRAATVSTALPMPVKGRLSPYMGTPRGGAGRTLGVYVVHRRERISRRLAPISAFHPAGEQPPDRVGDPAEFEAEPVAEPGQERGSLDVGHGGGVAAGDLDVGHADRPAIAWRARSSSGRMRSQTVASPTTTSERNSRSIVVMPSSTATSLALTISSNDRQRRRISASYVLACSAGER